MRRTRRTRRFIGRMLVCEVGRGEDAGLVERRDDMGEERLARTPCRVSIKGSEDRLLVC